LTYLARKFGVPANTTSLLIPLLPALTLPVLVLSPVHGIDLPSE